MRPAEPDDPTTPESASGDDSAALGEPRRPNWPARTTVAVAAGNLAARLSRVARQGEGGVIGGRVTLALQSSALAHLAEGRITALVTGTNGKTTTTRMLERALAELGPVACNRGGANMPDGLVAALADQPTAACGVLEVDEAHLPAVLAQFTPDIVVLLNLSRDQIDRVGEVRHTEQALREALARCPSVTVVANCDDVLVTSVAAATDNPVWVAAGAAWRADATSCPRCGDVVRDRTGRWWCPCGLARPEPDWAVDAAPEPALRTPEGAALPLVVGVPGPANAGNAAMAAAAAATLGVPLADALRAIGSVTDINGRYREVDCDGRLARLLLAKNPAGWLETLTMVGDSRGPVVLAINAHEADGRDLSWLWDVPFDRLAGRDTVVCGERGIDLAVRLTYAGVAHALVDDPLAAITHVPPGPVDVIANYTAFRDLTRRIAGDQ